MPFRDSVKENVWFRFLEYEYERSVRDLYEQGVKQGWLNFSALAQASEDDRRRFLREQATPFVCLSIRQAKELFVAAEQASDATKPLLSYYGMMNLVKGLLALDNPDFFEDKKNLRHGMSVKEGAKGAVNFQDEAVILLPNGIVSLGRQALQKGSICAPNERLFVRVVDLLKGLPDLYWDYLKVAKVPAREMNTFPFGFPDPTKFDGYSQMFFADTYIDKVLFGEVTSRLPLDLSEKFNFEDLGSNFHLKSQRKSHLIQELINLLDEFSTLLLSTNARFIPLKFGCVVETSAGGATATRTEAIEFTELEHLYLLMFYMGHTARYRPQVWDALISGRETEFVTILKKFLYYADTKFIALLAGRMSNT